MIMKIQIVNEKDELIGLKERSEVDYQTDIYRVSALWVTNSIGQVLLAQRASNKDKDAGLWGHAVAGTIDAGETYDKNIYKEAEEEIGLTGVEFTKGKKMRITFPRNFFCQWYFVNLDRDIDSFTMQDGEVDDLAWVDLITMKQELKDTPTKYVPALTQIVDELEI